VPRGGNPRENPISVTGEKMRKREWTLYVDLEGEGKKTEK